MEFVEAIFEGLSGLGKIVAICVGIFLLIVGLLMEKWSRLSFVTVGIIILLPFLSWALKEIPPLSIIFQKAKIVGQVAAVIVAIIAIIVGRWESGVWRALLLAIGILILMPLANFVFRFVSILFSLLVH